MNIAVIFGGKSDEHEVSRNSAVNVIDGLGSDRYEITQIGIKMCIRDRPLTWQTKIDFSVASRRGFQ